MKIIEVLHSFWTGNRTESPRNRKSWVKIEKAIKEVMEYVYIWLSIERVNSREARKELPLRTWLKEIAPAQLRDSSYICTTSNKSLASTDNIE